MPMSAGARCITTSATRRACSPLFWREICQPYILGLVESVVAQAMTEGTVALLPDKPLEHVLLAVADEAALYVNAAGDRAAARGEIVQVVRPLLAALTV